jgi:hypothetical protein
MEGIWKCKLRDTEGQLHVFYGYKFADRLYQPAEWCKTNFSHKTMRPENVPANGNNEYDVILQDEDVTPAEKWVYNSTAIIVPTVVEDVTGRAYASDTIRGVCLGSTWVDATLAYVVQVTHETEPDTSRGIAEKIPPHFLVQTTLPRAYPWRAPAKPVKRPWLTLACDGVFLKDNEPAPDLTWHTEILRLYHYIGVRHNVMHTGVQYGKSGPYCFATTGDPVEENIYCTPKDRHDLTTFDPVPSPMSMADFAAVMEAKAVVYIKRRKDRNACKRFIVAAEHPGLDAFMGYIKYGDYEKFFHKIPKNTWFHSIACLWHNPGYTDKWVVEFQKQFY